MSHVPLYLIQVNDIVIKRVLLSLGPAQLQEVGGELWRTSKVAMNVDRFEQNEAIVGNQIFPMTSW